jgi:hypothetical protein
MPGINNMQRNGGSRLDELFRKNGSIIVPSALIVLSRDDQDRFLWHVGEVEVPGDWLWAHEDRPCESIGSDCKQCLGKYGAAGIPHEDDLTRGRKMRLGLLQNPLLRKFDDLRCSNAAIRAASKKGEPT